GRAELRLAEWTAAWSAKPENRNLPTWWEWLTICLFTRAQLTTPTQQLMMRKATRYHAIRGTILAVLLVSLILTGMAVRNQVASRHRESLTRALMQRLMDANISQVQEIISEIEPYRTWLDPLLSEENAKAAIDSRQKLHTSLALLP